MNATSPDYRNALLTGRGLTIGEITEDQFLHSPVAVGPVDGPYRRIYDFPGETIESLKALWANAPAAEKDELNALLASMDDLGNAMEKARDANPGKEITAVGGTIFVSE